MVNIMSEMLLTILTLVIHVPDSINKKSPGSGLNIKKKCGSNGKVKWP